MIRRVLFAVLVLILGGAWSFETVSAQAGVVWVRGYPEVGLTGCVEYVAQWSDGSYTSTVWDCRGGVAQIGTLTAVRGYPQRAANGCIEYVTQWSDGQYSWVPFSCPLGVSYSKSAARGLQQLRLAPVAPAAPPAVVPPAPPAAPSGVTFTSVRGGRPGGIAAVSVQTSPFASCSIVYFTPAGTRSTAQGLVPRTADSQGRVSWSWVIGTATRPGTGTVTVTCDGVSATTGISIG
ncbi:MAG: hypothetical protein KatS3mg060_1181 [Dehalococcoidia bacterium]|nr:MAG: hypothetical protein KatS3mg060_1181 [Dehalococcoidia bacterium]